MRIRTNYSISARRWSAAAALLGMAGLGGADAAASEFWRFDQSRDGAIAQSCGGTGRFSACATLSCGPDGAVRFTLEDLTPGAPISQRGRVTSPGFSDKVTWRRAAPSRSGGADYVASGLNMRVLFDRLKRNSSLGVVINDRISRKNGEIYFTLRGSGRAIERLEKSCARLASRPGPRPGGRPGPDGRPIGPDRPGGDWRPVVPETSPWRYTSLRVGGLAQSCGQFPRRRGGVREICATLFCLRGREIAFGLDGLSERPGLSPRQGEIRIGRAARDVKFDLLAGPRPGEELFVANHPRINNLMNRLKSGDELEVSVKPRSEPLVFTLRNSGRAIERLRKRCERVAARPDDGDLVTDRYRRLVIGSWAVDDYGCENIAWRFDRGRIETPDGAVCNRVQVAEVAAGPLTGGVAVRGANCRGGDERNLGDVRIFETMREGRELIMRTVTSGKEIRIGDRAVFRLQPKSRIIRLRRCRRR